MISVRREIKNITNYSFAIQKDVRKQICPYSLVDLLWVRPQSDDGSGPDFDKASLLVENWVDKDQQDLLECAKIKKQKFKGQNLTVIG